jgi:hypothetical protein
MISLKTKSREVLSGIFLFDLPPKYEAKAISFNTDEVVFAKKVMSNLFSCGLKLLFKVRIPERLEAI